MAKVIILSGAGLSAQSGIDTFRDSGGLWEEYDVDKVCKAGCLVDNRAQTIEFYDKRRAELETKKPNYAHEVLADLKNKYKDDIAIITQNVDDLFEKAGLEKDKDVIHLHGFMTDVRCEKCGFTYNIGYKAIGYDRFDGKCPNCGGKMIRPHIVMFGEPAPHYELLNIELQNCELLVVIGTSGNVIGVNTMANFVEKSILNNLEPSDAIEEELFSKVLYKKATEAIEEIKEEIVTLLKKENSGLGGVLFTLGRGGSGKSEQLIATANKRPNETLFVSIERGKEELYSKRKLNKSVDVVNSITQMFENEKFKQYKTICIDNLESIDNDEYTTLLFKLDDILDQSIYLHISSHLKKDYKYHPRLNELSEILSKRENLEDL